MIVDELIVEENEDDENYFDPYEEIDKMLAGTGLTFSFGSSESNEEVCVGRSYSSLKNDETGEQFRSGVKEKLEKLVGHKVKCGHQQESWMDN
jgi:hypothetical protein